MGEETTLDKALAEAIAAHVNLYLTDPERAHNWDSTAMGGSGILPCLLMITTGRKSGEKRMAPLVYGRDGDTFVVVASRGGAPIHPSWFLNLRDSGKCEIWAGNDRYAMKARVSEDPERARLWEIMVGVFPGYNEYQSMAGSRELPVVVLEKA